jgi:predicted amidohydrolase YtcJ
MNPFATMARAGVPLALGSDSPVTPLGGWEMVRAAAYHRTPEHQIGVHEAFEAATLGGWRAARVDDAGVLAPGMQANYAIWRVPGEQVRQSPDNRPPGAPPPRLPDLSPGAELPACLCTVIRGRTIYDAS